MCNYFYIHLFEGCQTVQYIQANLDRYYVLCMNDCLNCRCADLVIDARLSPCQKKRSSGVCDECDGPLKILVHKINVSGDIAKRTDPALVWEFKKYVGQIGVMGREEVREETPEKMDVDEEEVQEGENELSDPAGTSATETG